MIKKRNPPYPEVQFSRYFLNNLTSLEYEHVEINEDLARKRAIIVAENDKVAILIWNNPDGSEWLEGPYILPHILLTRTGLMAP